MITEGGKAIANDTNLLKKTIETISQSPRKMFGINGVCSAFGIKRRGLYDFLSVSTIFGVCRKANSDEFEWIGLGGIEKKLKEISDGLERDATTASVLELFNCATNSSIQNVSVCVIRLFLYLNVRCLDLREIGKLFCQKRCKYKTMLRKLYTVASSLEIAGIISRTAVVAEIKLNFNPAGEERKAMDVRSLLNKSSDTEKEQRYAERREAYEAYVKDERQVVSAVRTDRPILAPISTIMTGLTRPPCTW